MEENKAVETQVEETTVDRTAELEAEIKRLKATLSEKNSENAAKKREIEDWKNKYNSTLDEQQLAEQQRAEREAEKEQMLKSLIRERDISGYKANFLGVGYSDELAQKSAEALVDGKNDVVFDHLKAYIADHTKAVEAEMLKKQPSIASGEPLGAKEIESAEMDKLRKYAGL